MAFPSSGRAATAAIYNLVDVEFGWIELANNIYKANLVGLVTYDIHNEYEQQLNQKICGAHFS